MAYQLRSSDEDVLICEGACVVGNVTLGKGVSIWYNAVIRGDGEAIVVGENTNVQDGAIIHTDPKTKVQIGKNCTLGHGAIVHGCTVGDNVLVGIRAVILDDAKIGDNCIIGAGSLVTGKMDAPAGSLILGSPAKVVRSLTEEELKMIQDNARQYLRNAERYRKGD